MPGSSGGYNPPQVPSNICNDHFPSASNRTGWLQGWTPVLNANQGWTTAVDWRNIGTRIAPSKVSHFTFDIALGNNYVRTLRCRCYMLVDYRILINGTAVLTRLNERYDYDDERNDTNPDVIPSVPVHIDPMAGTFDVRLNVPAGATVAVETRYRYNVNGAQTSAYHRMILGLRSKVKFIPHPTQFLVP